MGGAALNESDNSGGGIVVDSSIIKIFGTKRCPSTNVGIDLLDHVSHPLYICPKYESPA